MSATTFVRNWQARLTHWVGGHRRMSSYGIFAALIAMAGVAHPSLASYLTVVMIGGWLFILRGLAQAEGTVKPPNWWSVVIGAGVIVVVVMLMMRIQWLAL